MYKAIKMLSGGVILCVGGPALVYWVSPTEEELFKARRLWMATPTEYVLMWCRNTIQNSKSDR